MYRTNKLYTGEGKLVLQFVFHGMNYDHENRFFQYEVCSTRAMFVQVLLSAVADAGFNDCGRAPAALPFLVKKATFHTVVLFVRDRYGCGGTGTGAPGSR